MSFGKGLFGNAVGTTTTASGTTFNNTPFGVPLIPPGAAAQHGFSFGGGAGFGSAAAMNNTAEQWKYLPHAPCGAWTRVTDDASWILLFKRHIVNGGDLASLTDGHGPLSVFELVAQAAKLPGVPVFDFLLKYGAPIVLVDANKVSRDAFAAIVQSASAADQPHRIEVLKRFVAAGYTLAHAKLPPLLAAVRHLADIHAYLVSFARDAAALLAVSPDHFRDGISCAAMLRELDIIDPALSVPACDALLVRLLDEARLWAHDNAESAPLLLRRLRDNLPAATVTDHLHQMLTRIAHPSCAAALREVLTMSGQLESEPIETRLAIVTKAIRAQDATDMRLIAMAFDRTRVDVNSVLELNTLPLNLAVQVGGSTDVVRLLLAQGADVNGRELDDGSTPLHLSMSVDVDEVLVRHGGDPSLTRNDGLSALELINTTIDIDRRWFHLKVAPVIIQHRKHAELLDICVAIAPLLQEFPPEVLDRIVTFLPGMRLLDEGMRYSLFVRIGAAYAKKLEGESVDLPAREPIVTNKPVTVKEIVAPDAADAGDGARPRQRTNDDASGLDTDASQQDLQLSTAVPQLASNDPLEVMQAVMTVRKLLSIANSPPIDAVINAGIVPRLVELAGRQEDYKLVYEALWAITNICSGTSAHVQVAISCGAMNVLLAALRSPQEEVREQAVWGIGNIAGDSPQMRDFVIGSGVVPVFIEIVTTGSRVSMLRNVVWASSNLCRGKPQPPRHLVAPLVPVMSRLLFCEDDDVLTDALWSISYLSDGPNEAIQAVIEAGVTPRLVQLLSHTSYSVQTPALRALGNIITGDDVQTQVVLNCNFLPALLPLLRSAKRGIRKESAWAISNVTAGNRAQIQAVIDANLIPAVMEMLVSTDIELVKEAAWAVANLASGGSWEQIRYVVTLDAVAAFKPLLESGDSRVLSVALSFYRDALKMGEREKGKTDGADVNAIANLMEENDVVARLEALVSHANEEIYRQATEILTEFFAGEDEEVEGAAAPAAFTFAPASFTF
jgi:importin subunit alpha-1